MNKNAKSYFEAVNQLPARFSNILSLVHEDVASIVTQIKFRSNRPVVLGTTSGNYYIQKDVQITDKISINTICTSHADIQECFKACCGYSVHSNEQYINKGFVTLKGGHRVGICGTAVCNETNLETIKNITSLNIRIARTALTQCDDKIKNLFLGNTGGIIIAGEPGSGKTTVLRALMKELSDMGKSVAVIDERLEIAPVSMNGFSSNIPINCDVYSGYQKHVGMIHAIRSMAPDIILCDEIGDIEDVNAIKQATNAGVNLIITMHGNNMQTLNKRVQAKEVLSTGAFTNIVFLQSNKTPGMVKEVISFADDT